MAGFSEWSNKKKAERETSGVQPSGTGAPQTASSGAKSFSEWSNQKHGITAPQTYRSRNTAFENSGLTRDEFDSSVRSGYAERAAKQAAPATPEQSTSRKYNTGSVLQLGYGPISTERLEQLISTGAVTAQERNGQTYVSRAQQTAPARPGMPSALQPSLPSSFARQPAAAPAEEKKTYYSQPELGVDTEKLKTAATELEPTVTKKYEALQSATTRATELENSLKFIEGHLQTLYDNYQQNPTQAAAQLYENAYASYEQKHAEYETAVQTYNTTYQEYAPLYDQYSSAVAAYNNYVEQQQAQFKDWKSTIRTEDQIQADEDALDVQIDALKKQQSQLATSNTQLQSGISRARGYGSVAGLEEKYKANQEAIAELQAQLDELESSKALLKEERDWAEHYQYADLMEAQDWQQLSAPTAAKREADDLNLWKIGQKRGDDKYDFINDIDDYRMTVGALSLMTQQQNEYGDYTQYSYMNEDEIGIYNYLYAKQGKEAADEYLGYLEETLNYRWGLATAEDKDTDFERIMWAIPSGIDRFGTGIAQLFSKEDLPTTYTQYASQAVRQELGGVGGVAYDFLQTVSNMAPSILLSVATSGLASGLGAGTQLAATVGKVAGTGTMSLSAAGNAYNEKVKAGYDPDEARTYAALVGASEGLLQYALGGISKLGTGVNGGMLAQKIAGIDSAFGRIAANWGYSMFKEGMEEGLQEVLEPVFSSLIFNEEYDPAAMEEVAYSFLLGAMSAGLLEGGDVVRADANTRGTGAQFREMGDDVVQAVIDTGLESGKNTASYKIAMELQAKLDAGQTITDYELGRLYGENVQTVAAEEKAQRQSQRAQVNEFLNAQSEAAGAEVQGIVLPTVEDIYGKADTGSALPQTPAQRSSMLREPGMLPTAEDAELQHRMASAETETERSGIEAGANDEAIAQAVRLSSALGRDIVFYNEAASGTGIQNGRYENGTIYVNANSPNPLAQIISHELTHSVELADAYKDLSGIVMNRLSQGGRNVEQLRQAKMELYARNGHPLSEADADAEIVAEYVEKYLLTDERSIMQITHENKTLAQRILGWINDLLAKLGNASAQERAFLMRARDTYASALQQVQSSFNADTAAAAPAAQAGTQTAAASTQETTLEQLRTAYANGEMTDAEFDAALEVIMQEESTADESALEARHSYGGANANGADLDALRTAQQMQAQNVAAETIFRETGWYTGADGKWRFEIDDSGMQYSRYGTARNPDEARLFELRKKDTDGTITQEEWDEYRSVIRATRGMPKQTVLADYIQHDGLFQNYPQLRKATLRFTAMEDGTLGSYNPDTNTITLSDSLRSAPEDTLVHEIQHAIQKAEGFAQGSSPEYWASDAGKTKRAEAVERIQSEISSLEDMLNDGSEAESEDFIRADIEELKEKLDTLSFRLYQNTAGEVEAQDAARRRTMTPEQRRQTMPDTGDENTVFAEDTDEDALAIGRTTDNKPFVTVEQDILNGVPEADWVDTVKRNLKQKFPNGVTVGNNNIKINQQSQREMTYSGYMTWLYNNDPQVRADKLRATDNTDEILQATTDWVNEGLHHPRKDNITDFARGDVLLRVGRNDYTADVVVGTRKNGTMIMYDVLNLKPTSFIEKETDTVKAKNPSPGTDRSTASISTDSIREQSQEVNRQAQELSDRNIKYSIREEDPPKKTGIAYKVFVAKDGQLYPPMVANPGGEGTTVGVWLNADIGEAAEPSKTGRMQVKSGGKGTSTGKGKLAFRPGWHLGDIPQATQFARTNPETGVKDLFPENFVWAECEYAMDVDYQDEAMSYGYTESGKFRHAYAGLPKLPENGYYRYRTNPNPDTVPWVITGAMKVTRILTDAETDAICRDAGVEPMKRLGGEIDLAKYGLAAGDTTQVKTQFSLSEPVEQTDRLIAWHNMREDSLQSALELGGLAMPSFAIKPADMAHSDYGDISIIAARESIDPKVSRDQKIYGGDAWTPTFPDVSYKASDKVIQRVKEKLDRLVGNHEVRSKISRIGLDSNNMADTLKRNNGNIVEAFRNDDALKFAFLKDTGRDVELPMTEDTIAKLSGHDDEIIRRIANEYGLDGLREIREKGYALYDEDQNISGRLLEIINGYYRETMDGYDKDMFEDMPFGDYDRIMSDAYRYARDGVQQTVDTKALREMLEENVDQTEYEAWLKELFDGIVERRGIRNNADIFTPSGNRRGWNALHSDYTLANIIKEMRKQGQQGVSQLFSGAAAVKGAALKTYGDIEQARAETSRLRHTEAEAEAEYEKFRDSVTEVGNRMLEGARSERVGMFEMVDALAETLGKTKTRDGIKRYMQREFGKFYNVYEGIENDVYELYQTANNIPMQYFESKLYRGMPLDEAAAIVVPDTTKPELIGALENAGANVLTYEAGNEDSRLQVVNSIEGAKFSISENGEALPEAQLPTAEEMDTDITGTLPVKARAYLKRAERALLTKIGNALSVPQFARREYLNDIIREISTEYLQSGTVSQETIDALFDRAYDEGVEVDTEYYDQNKHIKDHLRTQAITISERDKGDIADYNDFRKSAFGTLRLVNEGGLPVDVAYMELQGMDAGLFPADITHPADQLVRMYDVARSIEKVERSLDEYHGRDADEFRKWAKNDFDVAVNDALSELRSVKRYTDERAQSAAAKEQVPTTQEEVADVYGQLKDARRAYEKAAAKNLLTQHDEVQVGRLLRGKIEPQNLDPAADNVKGITAVYEAKQEYERLTKLIKEYNQRRKAGLREDADGYLETANDWKDKKAGILYSRETMERNIRDIIKDKALAEQVIQKYFKPVHDAQAKSAVTKNKYRDRVRALNLSRKVAKGNEVSEAHAVQLLGEAEDNIRMLEQSRGKMKERDGKSLSDWRGIVENLWLENPKLDRAKIEAAIKEFRSIYDELFQQMNDARLRNGYEPVNYRKGYFPHFQPGDGDGIIAQFGKALGIDTEVTALPTTINGMTHTFKPGIRWFGNAQERLGFNTAYDAVEGFDKYIEGVADVIHQTDNIQSLRALTSQMRYRTGEEGIRKQVDAVLADTSLTEQDKQNRIDKIYESGKYTLSNFVVELEEYTNLLANKKSRADRNMEQALGRNAYNLVKALESRVAANMVAINPASWLTNFIPLTQGGAQLDRGMLLKGMWDTLRAYKADDGIVAKSTFLTNRRGSDPIVRTWAQEASAKMSSPMEYIDQFVADTLVRARYQQNIKKGLSETEAMTEADAWVAGVMADRSKGSMPTLFNRSNPITKVFTQFQLEVNNQLSYLFKDIPREQKDKGVLALTVALLKFFIGAYLYNELYEYIIGRRPALDPLGILNDTVGDITGYELPNLMELGVGAITGDMPSFEVEKKDAYDTVSGLAGTVAEELPFIGGVLGGGRVPISSALPDWENLGKALLSDSWSGEKKAATAAKELGNPLTYLALPFGGGQLKKIYQGLRAVIEGGSYTVNSEGEDVLQYPVYNDSPLEAGTNAVRAILFGKTSLPTAQDWIEGGFKSFGAKETAAYQGMTAAGVPDDEAYQLLQDMRGVQKTDEESAATLKRRLLQESDIDGAGKSVVYYGILASDKERELMDAMTDVDADMGVVTNVLMEIKDAGNLTGAAASNAKRDAIAEADLTDDEKEQVYRYMMGQKQEDGTYTSSRDDDIEAFRTAGLDFDQFIEAQNAYTTFNEEYSKAGEKATEFSRWVNSQTYTAEQAEIVKDSFKYFSQIPAEAGRYDGFMAAGLSDEASYELTGALNALEPEDGEDTVSSLQRYRAVVDAGLSVDEQMAAFSTLMDESEYARVRTGYSFGVTPAAYVSYKETLPLYDADGNGSFKQEEVEAAIDAMSGGGLKLPSLQLPSQGAAQSGVNLTNEQKAALWQMQNKSWKPRNNPYNTAISEQVYNALNTETGEGGMQLPSQGATQEESGAYTSGIVLPTAEQSGGLQLPSQRGN